MPLVQVDKNLKEKMLFIKKFVSEPRIIGSITPSSVSYTHLLSAEPRYLQKLPAPPAIETAYSEPVPHWLGIYVGSTLADGSSILDMDAAARCLKAEGSHPA